MSDRHEKWQRVEPGTALNGYCPSCGEAVAVDVFVIGMEHETERDGLKIRSSLVPMVTAPRVAHACRTEEPA